MIAVVCLNIIAIAAKLSFSLGQKRGEKRLISVIAARSAHLITIATKYSIYLGWQRGVQRLIPMFVSFYHSNDASIYLGRKSGKLSPGSNLTDISM